MSFDETCDCWHIVLEKTVLVSDLANIMRTCTVLCAKGRRFLPRFSNKPPLGKSLLRTAVYRDRRGFLSNTPSESRMVFQLSDRLLPLKMKRGMCTIELDAQSKTLIKKLRARWLPHVPVFNACNLECMMKKDTAIHHGDFDWRHRDLIGLVVLEAFVWCCATKIDFHVSTMLLLSRYGL